MPVNDDYASILASLRAVRSRWLAADWISSLLALLASLLCVLLFVGLAEGLFHLPPVGRWALLLLSILLLVTVLVLWVVSPLLRRCTPQQVARYVESRHPAGPELRNSLINAVQLASDPDVVSADLADRAIAESAQTASRFDLSRAVDYRPFFRRLALVVALGLSLSLFAVFFPGRLSNALERVLHPGDSRIGVVGSVGPVEVFPGDAEVALGEPFEVRVRIPGHTLDRLPDARIEWQYDDLSPDSAPGASASEARRRTETLSPASPDSFSYRMDAVEAPFRYCAWVGDSRSQLFTVKVVSRPFVDTFDLSYQYPSYTGLPPRTETASRSGAVEAPEGSTVKLTVHPSRPVARAEIRFTDGSRPVPLGLEPVGDVLSGLLRVPVAPRNPAGAGPDRTYSIYLEDSTGRGFQETTLRRIHPLPDRPPLVEIIQPSSDASVAPGASVELALRVGDDYGLGKVILWMKRNDEGEVAVKSWDRFDSPRQDTVFHKVLFDAGSFRIGEHVSFRAQALDNCTLLRPDAPPDLPTFQVSSSNTRTVYLRDPDTERKRLAEELRNWQTRVDEILKLQKDAQAAAGDLKSSTPVPDFRTASANLVASQTSIQKKTSDLVVDMESLTGQVLRTVRTALAVLARNDMVSAVTQSGKLSQLDPADSRMLAAQTELLATQARIVKVLTEILGLLPAAVAEQLAAASPDDPTSMSADAAKKWQALSDKLKEFIDQQKKVIADTSDLFKKNVDDFTDADRDKLKALAASQDDWAKFLKEAYADLSKIPDQDLSNPSLLKELLQVVEDVQKASDALTRQARELAVPLEQSGVENAQELTTHIEKWLPDYADRDQWKMEEPIGDLDAPMAELPKELEDIVGALMEEEEDLFDEVEDASSAWADSIDKGAGWDALDGPISNMSAQGVTGNQLPNSSEIGGRSGEGRTGKSSGEMVGEEAEGKGGRRTPTRLTPDPYEKGEVKDSSTEGSGGATGGGKLSGAGEQGLEGPVPAQVARQMQRLAGKQAELRNRAERVQLGFKVLNYPNAEVDRVVTLMKQVEDDLKNYRYRNALRRRSVLLKGLQASRLMVRQELAIHTDPTATLPPEIQREILDSADLAVPPEYEELVKRYYQSLAEP